MSVWAVVPAFNEVQRIQATVAALLDHGVAEHVLVVDDGSTDQTAQAAQQAGADVVRHERNRGKGAAVTTGVRTIASGVDPFSMTQTTLVFADADLEASARELAPLVDVVRRGEADLAIAAFRSPGGFGVARRMATQGIRFLTGFETHSPLSGQRALRWEVAQALFPFPCGWGLEVGMTVRALWNGFRVVEVPLSLSHRVTQKDLKGFWHRGRQCAGIASTLCRLALLRRLGRMEVDRRGGGA